MLSPSPFCAPPPVPGGGVMFPPPCCLPFILTLSLLRPSSCTVSGEDPVLGAALLPNVVAGIQQNVMAIVKHYIGNTQETDRTTVNEIVDEQLLMELYGPPFAAAVANASGVMCAYNLVNGVYACQNPFTLRTMLRGRYNFSGFVVCA